MLLLMDADLVRQALMAHLGNGILDGKYLLSLTKLWIFCSVISFPEAAFEFQCIIRETDIKMFHSRKHVKEKALAVVATVLLMLIIDLSEGYGR